MPLEIERKFLVSSNTYKDKAQSTNITQAYLSVTGKLAIRVRIDGMQASLAIKSKVSERVNREYEYNIPVDEAQSLMKLDKFPLIKKTRYLVQYKSYTWEVDEFHDENRGLIIAEIELSDKDEKFEVLKNNTEEVKNFVKSKV